ncbi:MAG: hypothetical protein ACOCRX_09440 [Candidatus Woesearchaeota archaeon]
MYFLIAELCSFYLTNPVKERKENFDINNAVKEDEINDLLDGSIKKRLKKVLKKIK